MLPRLPIALVIVSLLAVLLYGCSASQSAPQAGGSQDELDPGTTPANQDTVYSADSSPSIKLVVTTDFGKSLLLEETVEIGEETSALAALKQVAQVETQYGGGFVKSINGIDSEYGGDSEQKDDWLFYINGISSNVGAAAYMLQVGDVEHWDYRDWDFHQFVPAIVGDFPEPFLHGHRGVVYPTLVVYQEGREEEAGEIAAALAQYGVAGVSVKSAAGLSASEQESSNLILVGTADFSLIEEINQPWDRLGFYCHFEEGCLSVFDGGGEVTGEYRDGDGVGVVQATQSVWNTKGVGACENVVWMVSGTDDAGVAAAVDTLVGCSADFEYAFSLVVVDGGMVRVPR